MKNKRKKDMTQVACHAQVPAVMSRPRERAIGRMMKATVLRPEGDAQSDLVGDSFHVLYDGRVALYDRESMRPSRQINHDMLEWLMEDESLNETRDRTAHNALTSAMTLPVYYSLLSSEQATEDMRKKQKQAEKKEQEAAQAAQQAAQERANGNDEAADELEQQAENAMQEAQALAQAASENLEKLKDNPLTRGMLADAGEQAKEAADKADGFARSWGLEPGTMSLQDISDAMGMLQDDGVMKDIQEIADFIGRAEHASLTAIDATKNAYQGAVTEPTMTKDLRRLFPTERAKLSPQAPPLARVQALHDLFGGSGLMGWEPREAEEKSGVIIGLIDESSSMTGTPARAAKALGLGVAKAVDVSGISETRTYELYGFSSGGHLNPLVAGDDWRRHIEWASTLIGGGTNFDFAFEKALERVKYYANEGIDGADILFVTDGIAPLSNETKTQVEAMRQKIGMRLFTIDVTTWGDGGNQDVIEISDVYVKLKPSDLAAQLPQLANDIASQIAKGVLGS